MRTTTSANSGTRRRRQPRRRVTMVVVQTLPTAPDSAMSVRRSLSLLALLTSALRPEAAHAQFTGPCDQGGRPATRVAVAGAFVGGNAALYEYFRRAWWSGERSDFRVTYDWDMAFRDQDKLGHALGGYHLTRISSGMLRTACVGGRKATWWGAAYAAAFQLQIEVWDGVQEKYGFSPPDLLFNTMGAAWAVAQFEQPALQAYKPTISYARTIYARHPERWPDGTTANESRPSVDYAGQTYWISTDVDSLLPARFKPYWPGIVRLSVGHSVTDWIDPVSGNAVRGRRKLVLSLDLDPEKLPGQNRAWRQVKHQLSYYRFPAPALVLTPDLALVGWYR